MSFFSVNLELGSLVFVILAALALSVFVYWHDRQNLANKIFCFLSLSFAVWAMTNYFSIFPPFWPLTFWIRAVLFTAAPQAILFALFMRAFPKENYAKNKKIIGFFLFLLAIQLVLVLTPLVISGVVMTGGSMVPIVGPGMLVYAAILILSFGYGIYELLKKVWLTKGEERNGLLVIFYSFILMALLLVGFLFLAVVLFQNTTFIPYSHLFILPFIVGVGYTLTQQKFLNIKLVATEFFVGILIIILLTEALMSETLAAIIFKTLFAFFVSILGVLLIKSVYREINQRVELENINIRLQEVDRQKTEFISIASHQLRTPLSIFKGYIELIKDGGYGKIDQGVVKILNKMDINNEHLIKLVDEFLDITRIEQGRTKYDITSQDIFMIINSAIKELADRAKQNGMTIKRLTPKEKKLVFCDGEKIHHVIFNFIDNAIKYSVKGTIKVLLQTEDGGVAVRVTDNGLGFDKVDEVNFFQKFYRGANVKLSAIGGTGLGLYVCRKFIEAHHGRVWAHSEGLGKGSEFGFWVPFKQPTA